MVTVSEGAYRMLASGQPRTLQEFFSDCMTHHMVGAGEGAELVIRRMTNEMLGGRLLQLALISAPGNGLTNAAFAPRSSVMGVMS
jgi:hypothetical protein